VGLRQQIPHSHHAENSIQNSQSHSKCALICYKSYTPLRHQSPLRTWRHPWKNWETLPQTKRPSQSTVGATTTTRSISRLNRCWGFDLQDIWCDIAGCTPHHSTISQQHISLKIDCIPSDCE
jgi:hypothetical protein